MAATYADSESSSSAGAKVENITELMIACHDNDLARVDRLLGGTESNPAATDSNGKIALHYCAERCSLDLFRKVYEADPSLVDHKDKDGYTPMTFAIIGGNKDVVRFLIDKGVDTNSVDNEKHSLVHWATVCGQTDILELLLKDKALPSTPDLYGAHALHYATQMCQTDNSDGSREVMHLLLKYGGNVNCADNDERAPLLWAASAGNIEAMQALAEAGADKKSVDKDRLSALHCAASRGHASIIATLLNSSSDLKVDPHDRNGCTPLFYSVTLGHADCTRLLLDRGAQPNAQDKKLRTAAHCGAAKGQLKCLKILHQYGCSFEVQNHRGDLPIHEAVHAGCVEVVLWLLEIIPSSVSASNFDARTALHIATATGNYDLCLALLEHGADVNAVMNTKNGLATSLDIAIEKNLTSITKLLRDRAAKRVNELPEDLLNRVRAEIGENRMNAMMLARARTADSVAQTDSTTDGQNAAKMQNGTGVGASSNSSSSQHDGKPPKEKKKKRRSSKKKKRSKGQAGDALEHDQILLNGGDAAALALGPLKTHSEHYGHRSHSLDGFDELAGFTAHQRSHLRNGLSDNRYYPKASSDAELSSRRAQPQQRYGHIRFKTQAGEIDSPNLSLPSNLDEAFNANKIRSTMNSSVRGNLRRFMEEKRIFQELANLKRMQIQYRDVQEDTLVRRMVNDFLRGSTIVNGARVGDIQFLTFNAWEKFLYDQLKVLYQEEQQESSRAQNNSAAALNKPQISLFEQTLKRGPAAPRYSSRVDELTRTYGIAPLPLQYSPHYHSSRSSTKLPSLR